MPLASLGGGVIQWPPYFSSAGSTGNGAPGTSNFTAMTANGWQTICVFQIPASGTITHISARTGTVSGTTPQVTFALQTVNSSGQPTGTNYGSSTASSAQTVASNTPYELALGTPATATQGDLVALVIQVTSGTTPSVVILGSSNWQANLPYTSVYNTSTYTNALNAPLFTLGYSSIGSGGSGYVPVIGIQGAVEGFTATAWNSGSGTSRRALKFVPPCDMTVVGAWVQGLWAASSSLGINLYDNTNTNLITTAISLAAQGEATTGLRQVLFSTSVNVTNGSIYRLSLEPQNANNFTDYEIPYANSYQYASPINNLPAGTDAVLSTWNGSTWTDNANRRPLCGLLVSAFPQSANSSPPSVGVGPLVRAFIP